MSCNASVFCESVHKHVSVARSSFVLSALTCDSPGESNAFPRSVRMSSLRSAATTRSSDVILFSSVWIIYLRRHWDQLLCPWGNSLHTLFLRKSRSSDRALSFRRPFASFSVHSCERSISAANRSSSFLQTDHVSEQISLYVFITSVGTLLLHWYSTALISTVNATYGLRSKCAVSNTRIKIELTSSCSRFQEL